MIKRLNQFIFGVKFKSQVSVPSETGKQNWYEIFDQIYWIAQLVGHKPFRVLSDEKPRKMNRRRYEQVA
jgi:hypothetical protein